MGVRRWLRVLGLPLLVLGLQVAVAWVFVRTADAAWGTGAPVDALGAEQTTRWLFAAAGPLAVALLGWGLYATYTRLRLPAALASTALYLLPLLISGLSSWVLGVCLGWF